MLSNPLSMSAPPTPAGTLSGLNTPSRAGYAWQSLDGDGLAGGSDFAQMLGSAAPAEPAAENPTRKSDQSPVAKPAHAGQSTRSASASQEAEGPERSHAVEKRKSQGTSGMTEASPKSVAQSKDAGPSDDPATTRLESTSEVTESGHEAQEGGAASLELVGLINDLMQGRSVLSSEAAGSQGVAQGISSEKQKAKGATAASETAATAAQALSAHTSPAQAQVARGKPSRDMARLGASAEPAAQPLGSLATPPEKSTREPAQIDGPAVTAGLQARVGQAQGSAQTSSTQVTPLLSPSANPTMLTASGSYATPAFETVIDRPLSHPEFTPVLSARIATLVRDGVEHARVHLNPVEMGPVSLNLSMEGRQVRVDMTAEVLATRLVLEQSLPTLAGALREAGFTLSGGGVFQPGLDMRSASGTSDNLNGGPANPNGTDGSAAGSNPSGQPGDGRQPRHAEADRAGNLHNVSASHLRSVDLQMGADGRMRVPDSPHLVDMFA